MLLVNGDGDGPARFLRDAFACSLIRSFAWRGVGRGPLNGNARDHGGEFQVTPCSGLTAHSSVTFGALELIWVTLLSGGVAAISRLPWVFEKVTLKETICVNV